MKCPTCQTDAQFLGHNEFGSQISHCGQCGRAWQGTKVFVPAQAKGHAKLREACEAAALACGNPHSELCRQLNAALAEAK